MRSRVAVLEDRYTLGDSGTYTVDIDLQDPITQLEVRLDASNGATSNVEAPLMDAVDKIELVDGSDVLASVDGFVCRGGYAGMYGKVPNQYMTEVGSDTPYESFPLNFGRYLYDKQYALHPQAFRNPQLKITWNLANTTTVGASGFLSGSLKLSVNARVMEQVSNPVGFMMLKEVDSFTSAASGDNTTDMPTDYPYRYLLIRAFETEVDIRNTITNIKLSLDGDRQIPFDVSSEDLIYEWLNNNKPLHSDMLAVATDQTFHESWLGMSLGGQLTSRNTGVIAATDYWWKAGFYPYLVNHANAAQTAVGVFVNDIGACYANVITVPFGNPNEVDDWLQAAQYQSIKLKLTQGNAGGECKVALQQVRGY